MVEADLNNAASNLAAAEAGQSWGYDYVWSKADEAFKDAKKALIACRKAGDMEGRLKALDIVVKAELIMGDTFDALVKAQDELAMITRTNKEDKTSRATATELVIRCMGTTGDVSGALALVQDLLELRKELQDKAGEAKALRQKASLKLQLDQPKEAIDIAVLALEIFQELNDAEGEEETTRVLSHAWCQKGQPDRAPRREDALRALEALGEALGKMDAEAWAIQERALVASGAYSQSDLDEVINTTLRKNEDIRKNLATFLQDQGIDMSQYGGTTRTVCTEMRSMTQYLGWRTGGMGYGPHFRNLQQIHMIGRENEQPQLSAAVLQIDVDTENGDCGWEKEILYHPGILDGTLQGAASFKLL